MVTAEQSSQKDNNNNNENETFWNKGHSLSFVSTSNEMCKAYLFSAEATTSPEPLFEHLIT